MTKRTLSLAAVISAVAVAAAITVATQASASGGHSDPRTDPRSGEALINFGSTDAGFELTGDATGGAASGERHQMTGPGEKGYQGFVPGKVTGDATGGDGTDFVIPEGLSREAKARFIAGQLGDVDKNYQQVLDTLPEDTR